MGAVKAFYMDCAEAGRCPVSRETLDYLDDLESARQIDWIGYCEHDYPGRDGRLYSHDCIAVESARRLVAEGLANDEIVAFMEYWGDFCPAPTMQTNRDYPAGDDIGAAASRGESILDHYQRQVPGSTAADLVAAVLAHVEVERSVADGEARAEGGMSKAPRAVDVVEAAEDSLSAMVWRHDREQMEAAERQ